jgi:hypothetical protein
MNAVSVYQWASTLLQDYLDRFGMNVSAGPLRAARELTFRIVWTGSVQLTLDRPPEVGEGLTNAARLFARTPSQLEHAVKRLSEHLGDPGWDHREWAAAVLAEQTRHVQEDDLIPMDATELAKPYARRMEHLCTIRNASRVGDPLVSGYWC